MTDIQVFNNTEFSELRALEVDNEHWIIGKDICKAFGDTTPSRSLGRLDDDEKRMVTITDSIELPMVREERRYLKRLMQKSVKVIDSLLKNGVMECSLQSTELSDTPL